jgi:phosphoadenosine phosphosulfate reductase
MAVPVLDLEHTARRFEGRPPREVIGWALDTFAEIGVACSFGLENVALIDLVAPLYPDVRFFTIDTQLLFPQTYELARRIEERYRIRIKRIVPDQTPQEQAASYGDRLWERDPDLCCRLRKVLPLERYLAAHPIRAWLTGMRRSQSPSRAHLRVVEWDERWGLVKIHPFASWSLDDVRRYVREHDVPYNPLHDRGYPSIGCAPCTRPVRPGEPERAGRWPGFTKTECGLHGGRR